MSKVEDVVKVQTEVQFEKHFDGVLKEIKEVNTKQFGTLAPIMTQGFESMKELFKNFYEQGVKDAQGGVLLEGKQEVKGN